MATTAADIIKGAVRLLHGNGADIVLTARQMDYALEALQYLIDSVSNDTFTVYKITQETFRMTHDKASYTFGVGGDLDAARPTKILAIKLLSSNIHVNPRVLTVNSTALIVNTDMVRI